MTSKTQESAFADDLFACFVALLLQGIAMMFENYLVAKHYIPHSTILACSAFGVPLLLCFLGLQLDEKGLPRAFARAAVVGFLGYLINVTVAILIIEIFVFKGRR